MFIFLLIFLLQIFIKKLQKRDNLVGQMYARTCYPLHQSHMNMQERCATADQFLPLDQMISQKLACLSLGPSITWCPIPLVPCSTGPQINRSTGDTIPTKIPPHPIPVNWCPSQLVPKPHSISLDELQLISKPPVPLTRVCPLP